MSKDVQCANCGEMTEYLVDDGVCQSCFNKQD